jgi:pimeloyl-ACP methyl ester carboxylesterase
LIALARERGAAAIADEMLPKLLGGTSRRERPDVVARARDIAGRIAPDAIAGALVAMRDRPDSTRMLDRISCATLIIASDEDVVTPLADAEQMQQHIPRSRLVVLHGAGHLSNLELADQFSLALADFLASRM